MKRCYLKFGDGEALPFRVEAEGHGSIAPGTECRAKEDNGIFGRKGWYRVRIGEKVDHVGTRTNSGGAVYAAEALVVPEWPRTQRNLF